MSNSPRALSQRRSTLRWRMSYMGLAILGLIGTRVACVELLARAGSIGTQVDGLSRLFRLYQGSLVEACHWTVGALVVAMILTGVQLYFVGGRGSPARSSKAHCPECRGRLRRHTIRVGKAAGQAYWSCERHPRCGYSKRITKNR